MAFGICPNYHVSVAVENISQEEFLAIAKEAATRLGWEVSHSKPNGFSAFTKFTMTSFSEEVTVLVENSIADIKSECTGSQLYDWGKNKKNVNFLIDKMEEVKLNFSPDHITVNTASPDGNSDKEVMPAEPNDTKETSGFPAMFIPTKGYFITPILVVLNILIFLIMVISGVHFLEPENQSLINWGANFRPVTLEGQPWRLITNCFLHIGVFHLLLNMYALLYIGVLLEHRLGRMRFLTAYLLSGLIASMASLWWNDLVISAGASGAIFGLYGVFLALLTTNLIDPAARKALLSSIGIFVVYNIIYGFKPNSGIDNAAHIGGLIGGLVIGFAFIPSLRNPAERKLKFSTVGLTGLLVITTSFLLYKKMPNDIATYDREMKRFVNMETMALNVFYMPQSSSDQQILNEIKDRGLYYWNENLQLVKSFENMHLPEKVKKRNKLLVQYCELRIKVYDLLYKKIAENTTQYDNEIEAHSKEIERIMNEIRQGS